MALGVGPFTKRDEGIDEGMENNMDQNELVNFTQ